MAYDNQKYRSCEFCKNNACCDHSYLECRTYMTKLETKEKSKQAYARVLPMLIVAYAAMFFGYLAWATTFKIHVLITGAIAIVFMLVMTICVYQIGEQIRKDR